MELVEGELLSERIERAPIAPDEACAILGELLAAVGHAHANGIVHRDLKPGNVMLCERSATGGRVKVLDFGLAKNLTEASGDGLTRIGTVFGTPAYISPEQARAQAVDARGDLYAVGVMLFEMLCGSRPFVRESELELFQAHIQDPPPLARSLRPTLSAEIEAVIARALEKDRERRYQTAAELAAAIAAAPEARRAADASLLPHAATVLALPTPSLAPATEPRLEAAATGSALTTGPVRPPAPRTGLRARWLAPPRRFILLGGGLLAATLVTLALLVSGRDGAREAGGAAAAPDATRDAATKATATGTPATEARTPKGAAGAPATAETAGASLELQRAEAELAAGRLDSAIAFAREAVKRQRSSPRPYVVLGDAYYGMMWYTDALEEYGKAIKRDAALRSDPKILRRALRCLGKHGVWRRASAFLIAVIGAPAEPALVDVAARHPDPNVRGRASYILERLRAR
jgi:serine/threonine-protein kinase